ncbi:hypothetical protein EBU95_03760 [bacterium]|nr:hypothetical protein [bacterium]
MKKNKTNKTELVLKADEKFFEHKKNNKLTKAAKKVMRTINGHFKKDKWPLSFSFLVEEVFYEAHGEHLSNYLLKEIATHNKYSLYVDDKGTLVINLANKK